MLASGSASNELWLKYKNVVRWILLGTRGLGDIKTCGGHALQPKEWECRSAGLLRKVELEEMPGSLRPSQTQNVTPCDGC